MLVLHVIQISFHIHFQKHYQYIGSKNFYYVVFFQMYYFLFFIVLFIQKEYINVYIKCIMSGFILLVSSNDLIANDSRYYCSESF